MYKETNCLTNGCSLNTEKFQEDVKNMPKLPRKPFSISSNSAFSTKRKRNDDITKELLLVEKVDLTVTPPGKIESFDDDVWMETLESKKRSKSSNSFNMDSIFDSVEEMTRDEIRQFNFKRISNNRIGLELFDLIV